MHGKAEDAGKLLRLAQEFSPQVEQTSADTVALDADGLERIYGLPQQIAAALARRAAESGLQASVAIAANLEAAVHAARGFAGVNVIPWGDEAKYLGSLPVTLLEPSPEMLETLERWGIRRLHDLAALPELGLAERLGPEGLRLHKLARGAGERVLVPVEEPLHFEEEAELEYPVELLEPLMFVLSRMLHGLGARLSARGLATNELRLRLKLEKNGEHARTLRFPVPMLDTKAFLKLLDLDLSGHPPPEPVVRVWLEAVPAKPRAAQAGLFVPIAPEPEKLELTLARLRGLVGEGNVGTAELLDTHRPGAFLLRRGDAETRGRGDWGTRGCGDWETRGRGDSGTGGLGAERARGRGGEGASGRRLCDAGTRGRGDAGTGGLGAERVRGRGGERAIRLGDSGARRQTLRVLRPARMALVQMVSGQPVHLRAEGVRGHVVSSAGPWRTSGDWWTADPWARDEWDVALSDGALYRIYCERGGWFVDGCYD